MQGTVMATINKLSICSKIDQQCKVKTILGPTLLAGQGHQYYSKLLKNKMKISSINFIHSPFLTLSHFCFIRCLLSSQSSLQYSHSSKVPASPSRSQSVPHSQSLHCCPAQFWLKIGKLFYK